MERDLTCPICQPIVEARQFGVCSCCLLVFIYWKVVDIRIVDVELSTISWVGTGGDAQLIRPGIGQGCIGRSIDHGSIGRNIDQVTSPLLGGAQIC